MFIPHILLLFWKNTQFSLYKFLTEDVNNPPIVYAIHFSLTITIEVLLQDNHKPFFYFSELLIDNTLFNLYLVK